MLDERLLDILVCPQCKGELEHRRGPEELVCHACALRYQVQDDIPIMLIDEARPLEPTGGQQGGTAGRADGGEAEGA